MHHTPRPRKKPRHGSAWTYTGSKQPCPQIRPPPMSLHRGGQSPLFHFVPLEIQDCRRGPGFMGQWPGLRQGPLAPDPDQKMDPEDCRCSLSPGRAQCPAEPRALGAAPALPLCAPHPGGLSSLGCRRGCTRAGATSPASTRHLGPRQLQDGVPVSPRPPYYPLLLPALIDLLVHLLSNPESTAQTERRLAEGERAPEDTELERLFTPPDDK